jgi:O-acetyl-ADP-ribose deacetylase (regulator of RNase III)
MYASIEAHNAVLSYARVEIKQRRSLAGRRLVWVLATCLANLSGASSIPRWSVGGGSSPARRDYSSTQLNPQVRAQTAQMSSAYYLAKPIKASAQESAPPRKSTPPRDHTPPRKMAVTMEDMPTLSTLYNEGTIIRCDDKPLYKAAAALNDKISVIRQDITKLAVDSIVNAANTSLLGGGGVDGAIHCAAGPRLYDECETLRGCKTGSAKITDGYELPSNKVIHAVGPIYWREGKAASADLLAGCYRTSLELAVESGCKSIAFSALSTGVYGYPSGEASWVALETVRKFLEGETASKLDRVIFCNFLEKDEVAYFENIP